MSSLRTYSSSNMPRVLILRFYVCSASLRPTDRNISLCFSAGVTVRLIALNNEDCGWDDGDCCECSNWATFIDPDPDRFYQCLEPDPQCLGELNVALNAGDIGGPA